MNKLLLIVAVLALSASAASATVLWDQTDVDLSASGYPDAESAGMWGTVTVYGASDFTLGSDAIITSVTTYYTNTGQWVPGNYTALLDVFVKTGPSPVTGTDDPLTTGVTIPVTLTDMGNGTFALNGSGLNIALPAGDYWIMMSPAIPDGPSFREFHVATSSVVGDFSNVIEFGGWFGPSWGSADQDGAMLIEGEVAVATESVSFGGVKSLFR